MPVVDDLVICTRHQEGAHVRGLALFVRHETAQEHPLACVASARERPLPTKLHPAVNPLGLGDGHVRGRDQRFGILAPDLVLRFGGEERELPRVHVEDAVHPGARRAAAAELELQVEDDRRVHLVAAKPSRLDDLEEAKTVEVLDRLVGNPAQLGRLLRPLLQRGREIACALDQLLSCRDGALISVHCRISKRHRLGAAGIR